MVVEPDRSTWVGTALRTIGVLVVLFAIAFGVVAWPEPRASTEGTVAAFAVWGGLAGGSLTAGLLLMAAGTAINLLDRIAGRLDQAIFMLDRPSKAP